MKYDVTLEYVQRRTISVHAANATLAARKAEETIIAEWSGVVTATAMKVVEK